MNRPPPPLPGELVAAILECVPQLADLRRAASASRMFYAAAWHAGLYIHRRVSLYRRYKDDTSLQVLREVVQHALAKDLRLSLSLEWRPSYCSKHADDLAICTEAIAFLKASLPVLVSLRLGEPREALDELIAALCFPAPRLRSLQLEFCMCIDNDHGAPPLITPSIFAGSAPRLSELGTECLKCNLGSRPVQIPVFAKVSRLQVRYHERLPALKLHLRLPHLSVLELVCQSPDLDIPLDLSGLALKSLIFHDVLTRDAIPHPPSHLMTLESAPQFHYVGRGYWRSLRPAHLQVPGGRTDDESQDSGPRPVNVRLAAPSSDRGVVVSVVAADTGRDRVWRRSYHFRTESADTVVRNIDSPGLQLHERLAYLRLSTVFLSGLLLHCATEFPVLTKIRVDLLCDKLIPLDGPFNFFDIGACSTATGMAKKSRFRQLALVSFVWCGPADVAEASYPTVQFEELDIVARALALAAGATRPALHFVGLDVELRGSYLYETNFCGCENADPVEKLFRLFSEVIALESDDEGMWEERGSLRLRVAERLSMHCLPC